MAQLRRGSAESGELRQAALALAERATQRDDFEQRSQDEDLAYKGDTRKFRGEYAKAFRWLLMSQLLVTNFIFIAVGSHWLVYDPVTLRIFIGATIGEIVALVMIVVRHFFPLHP